MKNLILVATFALLSASTFGQSFDKLEKNDNVTKLVLSKSLFSLISKADKEMSTEDKKVVDFFNRIKSLKMYATTDHSLRSKMKSITKKFRKSKEFEELMRVNDSGKEVEFLVKNGKNDEIKELIMFIEGSDKNESVVFQLSLS